MVRIRMKIGSRFNRIMRGTVQEVGISGVSEWKVYIYVCMYVGGQTVQTSIHVFHVPRAEVGGSKVYRSVERTVGLESIHRLWVRECEEK